MTGLSRFIEWLEHESLFRGPDNGIEGIPRHIANKARSLLAEEKAKEQGLVKELRAFVKSQYSTENYGSWGLGIEEILSKYNKEAENGK